MKKMVWKSELNIKKYKCITCGQKLTSDDILFSKHSAIIRKEVQCHVCGTVHKKQKGK